MNRNDKQYGPPLQKKERKDLGVLATFTEVYCRGHHEGDKNPFDAAAFGLPPLGFERYRLCTECRDFLAYAVERRLKCPLDPKPTCKHCHVHCYRPEHRERVREVMRYSGKALIMRGRLDLLWHYFF